APAIIKIRNDHRLKVRKLELEAGGGGAAQQKMLDENKLLRDRVENLESIVCSVDFELNQKLAKLVDEQRSSVPATTPATPATSATPSALDKTATAMVQRQPAP